MHLKIGSSAESLKDDEFELIHYINNEIAQLSIIIVQVRRITLISDCGAFALSA